MANKYNTQLQSNNTDLQAILTSINELPEAGGGDPVLQDKTVTPTTSKQTITADSGYDGLDTVTVNAMPTATQATPTITVNASGLITATVTQTAGYIVGGTKSATKQLAFQAAKTITPTTTNQTAVSSGYYTGGAITVKGDSNLVAGNIKSGVSIFGVNGTYAGSGSGGDTSAEDSLVTRTLTSYTNDRVTSIGGYVFYSCTSLTSVNFPACKSIGNSAFYNCAGLTSVNFPACTSIGNSTFKFCVRLTSANFPLCKSIGDHAFYNCTSLTSVSFPVCTSIDDYAFCTCVNLTSVNFPLCKSIGDNAFYNCTSLTTVSLPICTSISGYTFCRCYNLKSLYLTGSSVCKLSASNAFNSTPIGGYSTSAGTYGSIYVPASLLTSYKNATNWTYFSSRFVGI